MVVYFYHKFISPNQPQNFIFSYHFHSQTYLCQVDGKNQINSVKAKRTQKSHRKVDFESKTNEKNHKKCLRCIQREKFFAEF